MRALEAEYRQRMFRIHCATCGRERVMTGGEVQFHQSSGRWEREL